MTLRIHRMGGAEAKNFVDEFYVQNGGAVKARPEDQFFLAYDDDKLIGSVRFCVEENVPMLRSMMIHRERRKQKIGLKLLNAFEKFLEQEGTRNTHCLPHDYLEIFYAKIGFKRITGNKIPEFLQKRMDEYSQKFMNVICMRRE